MPETPGPAYYGSLYNSAFGNDLLVALAEKALESERLGQCRPARGAAGSCCPSVRERLGRRGGDLRSVLVVRFLGNEPRRGVLRYDTHIAADASRSPGIRPGRHNRMVALNDLAPTLATLLGIETPSGSSGTMPLAILDAAAEKRS